MVVNDFGGARDGTGGSFADGRRRWSSEIIAAGGKAVANGDDVSTWRAANPS